MNNKLSKILTIITGIIGFIGFFYFIRIVIEGEENIKIDAALQNSILSPFITFAIILLIATAIISVTFSMVNLVKHPQVLKRSLIGVGVLGALLVLAYSFASDGEVLDVMGNMLEGGEAGSVSKWISTGINFSAILGILGFGAFFVDFVKSLIK